MASLVFVAERVGKLTTAQKNYMWQQFSMAKIRTQEPPELGFPREEPTIISSLLRAHIENLGYGMADLAQILAMTTAVTQGLADHQIGSSNLVLDLNENTVFFREKRPAANSNGERRNRELPASCGRVMASKTSLRTSA